jgi:hypothetical protein
MDTKQLNTKFANNILLIVLLDQKEISAIEKKNCRMKKSYQGNYIMKNRSQDSNEMASNREVQLRTRAYYLVNVPGVRER